MEYDLLIIGFGISGIATSRWAQKNGLNYKVSKKLILLVEYGLIDGITPIYKQIRYSTSLVS